MRSRVIAIAAVLLVAAAISTPAQQFRNIASFAVDYDFDATFETTLVDVFLAPIADRLTLQTSVTQISGSDRSLTMLSVGPIVVIGPPLYTITLYGIGIDRDSNIVHEIDLQAHYETADYRFSLSTRGQLTPNDGFFYLVPSIGARFVLGGGLGIQTTYFFSWNSDNAISNALWSEVDYRFNDRWRAKLGGTFKYGEDSVLPNPSRISGSAITGFTAAISPSVNLGYHFEYFARGSAADGLRNLVIVDWRF